MQEPGCQRNHAEQLPFQGCCACVGVQAEKSGAPVNVSCCTVVVVALFWLKPLSPFWHPNSSNITTKGILHKSAFIGTLQLKSVFFIQVSFLKPYLIKQSVSLNYFLSIQVSISGCGHTTVCSGKSLQNIRCFSSVSNFSLRLIMKAGTMNLFHSMRITVGFHGACRSSVIDRGTERVLWDPTTGQMVMQTVTMALLKNTV